MADTCPVHKAGSSASAEAISSEETNVSCKAPSNESLPIMSVEAKNPREGSHHFLPTEIHSENDSANMGKPDNRPPVEKVITEVTTETNAKIPMVKTTSNSINATRTAEDPQSEVHSLLKQNETNVVPSQTTDTELADLVPAVEYDDTVVNNQSVNDNRLRTDNRSLVDDSLLTADDLSITSPSIIKERPMESNLSAEEDYAIHENSLTQASETNHNSDTSSTEAAEMDKRLLQAAEDGNAENITKYLEQGADIFCTNEDGETPLHVAARLDNLKAAAALLKQPKDKSRYINVKDNEGWTPAYAAAKYTSGDMMSMILGIDGINLKTKTSSGKTPLYGACSSGEAIVVRRILETNDGPSTIEITDNDGWTPLHVACSRGDTEIVGTLLYYSANVNCQNPEGDTALHIASTHGKDSVVLLLLRQPKTVIDARNSDAQTALHLAAKAGHHSTAQILVIKGANIDLVDSQGFTALILCCLSVRHRWADENDERTVKLLAGKTNIINHIDEEGYTALDRASEAMEDKLLEVLLDHDADPNFNNNGSKWSILRSASSRGNVTIMKKLLDEGAKYVAAVDYADQDRWTALHQACYDRESEAVRILLEAKADATIKTEDKGELPLHIAAKSGDKEAVRLLLDSDINIKATRDVVDATTYKGKTALHLAACEGHHEVVGILLAAHSDVDATTYKGETALHLATREGHHEVVGILLAAHSDVNARTNDDETPLQLAGRGSEEGHPKIIRVLSSALKPRSRRDMLLDMYGDEDPSDIANVVKYLDWTGLDRPDVEEQGEIIKGVARKEEHTNAHDVLRQRAYRRAKTDPLPSGWKTEDMTALQLAAYLGDHLIVWWLLYIEWSKEMKSDCYRAIEIAQHCKSRLSSYERKVSFIGLDSKNVLKVNKVAETKILNEPDEADKAITTEKQPSTRQALEHEGRPKLDSAQSAQSTKSASKKKDQGNEERRSKQSQKRSKECKTRILDYSETVETLQDPPIYYSFVRGRSETDYLKTKVDENIKQSAEKSHATIVDFYRLKKGVSTLGDGRVDFLRRTRSVWDVVYAKQEKQMKARAVEEEDKTKPNNPGNLVDEPIYGPARIMEDARSKARKSGANSNIAKQKVYNEDDLQFRWLHLPANNLEWMIDLTKRIYRDKKKTQEEFNPLAEFLRQSLSELPGNRPYMRPSCTKELVRLKKKPPILGPGKKVTAEDKEDTLPPTNEGLQGQAAANSKNPESLKYWRLALYMPYLTFATYKKPEDCIDAGKELGSGAKHEEKLQIRNAEETKNAEIKSGEKAKTTTGTSPGPEVEKSSRSPPISQNRNNQLSAAYSRNSHMKSDSKSNAKNDWRKLQESRTLDEYYYHFLSDTEIRNANQVVTRYIDMIKRKDHRTEAQWDILQVDQLWLWVIDDKTIITSSTNRLDDKDDPILEGILNDFKKANGKRKGQPLPSSVEEMSKFITTFCIDQINKSTLDCEGDNLSARQIFANTINNAANSETRLFDNFHHKIEKKLKALEAEREKEAQTHRKIEPTEQEKDYQSIRDATKLLTEVKDIRDELNILNYLLTQQKGVWEKLLGLLINADGSVLWNKARVKEIEKWKGPGYALKEVMEMEKVAQRIQDSVNAVIGLEQNEANISEAESARKQTEETIDQGRTLMLFTVITIVFLPMSFLASLFALNITSFPHADNNLVYEPSFIFSIIFGVTAVVSIPAISYARYKHRFPQAARWLKKCIEAIIHMFKLPPIGSEPSAPASKSSEQEHPNVPPSEPPQHETDAHLQPPFQAEKPKSPTGIGFSLDKNRGSSSLNGKKLRWVHFYDPASQEKGELEQLEQVELEEGREELELPRLGIIKRRINRFRYAFRSNASPNHSNDEETGLKK